MQNVVAVIVLVSIAVGVRAPARSRGRARLTFNRDALLILAMIGGVVADRAVRPGLRGRPLRRPARGVRRERARRSRCAALSARTSLEARLRRPVVGPHRARRRVPRATCRSASTSTSRRRSRTSTSASSRRAASCRRWTSRREDATFGLKTLQDLGWKDLLDGFTCTECGRCQEACPAYNTGKPLNPKALHHGHPGHVGRGRARPRPHPELADRARDLRPRRHDARGRPAWRRRSSTTRSRTTRSGTA